jgi:hypothetical protein
MKFDSKSVLLNRGINYRLDVEIPPKLSSYILDENIWNEALDNFNKRLSNRNKVSAHIGDIKIDVIRLGKNVGNVVLWVIAKSNDTDALGKINFKLKGQVIFKEDSDVKVDKMVIRDILFGDTEGIFSGKS